MKWLDVIEQAGQSIFRSGQNLLSHPRQNMSSIAITDLTVWSSPTRQNVLVTGHSRSFLPSSGATRCFSLLHVSKRWRWQDNCSRRMESLPSDGPCCIRSPMKLCRRGLSRRAAALPLLDRLKRWAKSNSPGKKMAYGTDGPQIAGIKKPRRPLIYGALRVEAEVGIEPA